MRALPLLVALVMLLAPIAGAAGPVGAGALSDDAASFSGSDIDAKSTDTDEQTGNTADPESGDEGTISPASGNETIDPGDRFRVLATPPDADTRVAVHGHGANLGAALDWDTAEVDAALETTAIVREIENADTAEQRQRLILAAVNEVEQDEVSLNSRQSAAITQHTTGEITDRELLEELTTIAIVAHEYDERLDVLDELAEETDDFSAPSRLDELQVQLQVYEGPIRDHALATARGETGGIDVHVESSADAVVLTAIIDDEYVREVFRGDRWDRGGGSISSEEAINVTAQSYPETAALREADSFGIGSIQRITLSHENGELRTFVSGGSEQVFIERQRIALDAFPDYETVTTSADGYNLSVDRTYPGGPIRVTVLDDEDGTPVYDVTVTMSVGGGASESIGTTDSSGVVWTLSPTDTYRITVVDEPRVAVIDDIAPIETPRLTDDQPIDG